MVSTQIYLTEQEQSALRLLAERTGRSHGTGLIDALVAACAETSGSMLVTLNV